MSAATLPSKMLAYATNQRSLLGTLWHAATHFSIGHQTSIREVDLPVLEQGDVLVKVKAVAQNPTDFKHIDLLGRPNSIIGCDFAGRVVKVGAHAKGNWREGDRIAGVVHGGLYPDRGSYAEYLKVDSDLAWKIPDAVTDEEAATFGVSAVSAMQALILNLRLPWPNETSTALPRDAKKIILIYSGATSASLFAIQLAKLAGFHVITTCSPRSRELVLGYGADTVFDYRDPDALTKIIREYPDLRLAFDGFSDGKSTEFCCNAVVKSSGKVVSLDPMAKSKSLGVELVPMLMYTVFGRPFALLQPVGPKYAASLADRAGLARFYAALPGLITNR
ncbi:hypothetical protein NU219Hw_g8003t1 [Hortaea werneckii]